MLPEILNRLRKPKNPKGKSPGKPQTLRGKPSAKPRTERGKPQSGRPAGNGKPPSAQRPPGNNRPRTPERERPPQAVNPKYLEPPGLSLDRKLDILGMVLFVLGLGTLLSLFAANQNNFLAAWIKVQQQLAGVGMFGLPIGFMAVGLWLVLRKFGDRLPQVPPDRVLGIVLLYLALLTTLHFAITPNPTPPDFPEFFDNATQGLGGGLIGAVLLSVLYKTMGALGSVIVLGAAWLLGIVFAAGKSLSELVLLLIQLWERLPKPERPAPPAPTPPIEPFRPAESFKPPEPAPTSKAAAPPPVTKIPAPTPIVAAPLIIGGETPEPPPVPMPTLPEPKWVLPITSDVLEPGREGGQDDDLNRARQKVIEDTLAAFGVPVMVKGWNPGPTITQFCVEPGYIKQRSGGELKVKISKIAGLADDLALALEARSIRIEAPVPGTNYVGIEVPNAEVALVSLRDVMEAPRFGEMPGTLRLGLGQDVSGAPIVADLGKMPHMLIAGTTGSGKSVCVNSIIACLLIQNTPEDLKFVMIDPKRVELTGYNGIPHLFAPVVVDLDRVVATLQWVTREMDNRYHKFAKSGVRDIAGYNSRLAAGERKMPYLVIIIDELADLMMMAPDETERSITRLAQLARATGIHLIIATQRPSVDVVTGLIKANFKARVAFAVASSIDSRVILDQPGAERLLGRGDMLFQAPDAPSPLRMQGVFLSDDEIQRVVHHWKSIRTLEAANFPPMGADSGGPDLSQPATAAAPAALTAPKFKQAPLPPYKGIPDLDPTYDPFALDAAGEEGGDDPLLNEAIAAVREMKKASISSLQRRLRIGYTRSARLIDLLEEKGIVGPAKPGAQQREVIGYTDAVPDLANEKPSAAEE